MINSQLLQGHLSTKLRVKNVPDPQVIFSNQISLFDDQINYDKTYNSSQIKFYSKIAALSPWLDCEKQQIHFNQSVISQNKKKKVIKYSTFGEKIKRKQNKNRPSLQNYYKLSNTYVQFQNNSQKQSKLKNRSSKTEQKKERVHCLNSLQKIKNKEHIFTDAISLIKSPKIKYLQRKFKIKQLLNIVNQKKTLLDFNYQSKLIEQKFIPKRKSQEKVYQQKFKYNRRSQSSNIRVRGTPLFSRSEKCRKAYLANQTLQTDNFQFR